RENPWVETLPQNKAVSLLSLSKRNAQRHSCGATRPDSTIPAHPLRPNNPGPPASIADHRVKTRAAQLGARSIASPDTTAPRSPRTCESLPPSSPSPSHYHSPDSGTSSRRIPIVRPGPTSPSPDSVFFPPAPSIPIVLSSTPD